MMGSNNDEIFQLFASYQKNLDDDESLREEIRETTNQIDQISRELITTYQVIHFNDATKKFPEIFEKCEKLLASCKQHYTTLSKLIPKNEFYKYHDMWKMATQKIVFIIALTKFLETGELATREYTAEKLSLQVDRTKGFHLNLEDYLHGLLQLASELARYAVTSATAGDYSKPIQISQFVTELNAGFRLLNFKNDALRKRYDGLKYDLKKIEEVVYDLSIRGLKHSSKTDRTVEEEN